MRTKTTWTGLLAMLIPLWFVSGCLIVSGEINEHEEECWQECEYYTVCEPYCDAYACQEECWEEKSCETRCTSEAHFPDESEYFDEPEDCYSDLECADGRICIANECVPADSEETGDGAAGLCQTCESRHDCIEDGALCLGFLADESDETPQETVCGRVCQLDGDCPDGFECLVVDNTSSGDEIRQCVPIKEEGEPRSCSAGGELECVTGDDCAVAESCVQNECQPPEHAECTADGDCADDEICEVFECVDEPETTECVTSNECPGNDECIDGECVAMAESCVFNADCDDDERCVDGHCILTCSHDTDCGSSERCRDGICEYIECYNSSDCTPDQACVDASCKQKCNADGDCADGYLCTENAYCTADPDVECRYSAECASDEACNDDLECEPTCTCNDECSGDLICGEDSNLCVEPDAGEDGLEC